MSRHLAALLLSVILGAAPAAVAQQQPGTAYPPPSEIAINAVGSDADALLTIASNFVEGEPIPAKYSAEGGNVSPRLEWSGMPEGTKSFVVIMEDPDAKEPNPFVHWIVYDVPGRVDTLKQGLSRAPTLKSPKGAKQGKGSTGATGYFGPNPPAGEAPHHYHFQIFALNVASLGLPAGASREEVLKAMERHVVAKGEIVGTFERRAGQSSEKT